ncbi:MAG TPA: hypothetical protein VM715_19715, partial [Candidatus Acidoferrum sp.]|nr:hypothetical protein [Candidatus Acidoferrum sp.]
AVGVFLLFGMSMASLAGLTLAWRGTFLDRIWALNPTAYTQLAPLGRLVGAAFLLLAVALGVAQLDGFCDGYGDGDWRSRSSPYNCLET